MYSWVLTTFRKELDDHGTSVVVQRGDGGVAVGQRSSLEMKLHKLQFVELLRAGHRSDAVRYARAHFPAHVDAHEREVQALMGAVMYAGEDRLLRSPYRDMLNPSLWEEITELFVKDACSILGLSVD